jgi:pimeloyl-ACP methyl ester carboxylesterase
MAARPNPVSKQVIDGASHSSMVSHPDQVTDVIRDAVTHLDEAQ